MKIKFRFMMPVLLALCLTACMEIQPDDMLLRDYYIYGVHIHSQELLVVESVALAYTDYLLNVDHNVPIRDSLTDIAPDEDPDEWDKVFSENHTYSVLNASEIIQVSVVDENSVNMLILCEASYQDNNTQEDDYYFLNLISLFKLGDDWKVDASELQFMARISDVDLSFDPLNNSVQVNATGGGEN